MKKRAERADALMEGDAMDPFYAGGSNDATPAPSSSGGGDLLDLNDIFGGGGDAAPVATQNGNALKSPSAKSETTPNNDADLLADIFSAPAAPAPAPVATPAAGGFDIFGGGQSAAPAPALQNDLFAPQPATVNSAPSLGSSAVDPFAVPTLSQQPQQASTPATIPSSPTAVGGPTPSLVTVQGFSHQGLTVEFECTKPDTWNKQNSLLVAKFIQVAVPKYVTMEMKPPTSTTVPVTGGSSTKQVTQTVSVTNTMLGTKNLMLKMKASFTSKGTKVEHLATCSGFPAGQY
jgi:AP-1 complex subunit gamma-1